MHEVWTISECHQGRVKDVSYELLARGRALAETLKVRLGTVVIGCNVRLEDLKQLSAQGADIIYLVDDPSLSSFVCERYAEQLLRLITAKEPQIIIAAATTSGRTLMPYVAVKAHAGLTADCTELAIEEGTGNLLQTRPAIGGNIMATIKTPNHRPQMATVRPRSTKPLEARSDRPFVVEEVAVSPKREKPSVEVLGLRALEGQSGSIEEADIVISGGKGLKKRDNFALIERLAKAFGAEVGASRDAVDRGWASYPHQVGLSGKTISPRLYLAAGISGAIQHLAGIKTAKCIVAINSDEQANILGIADFAIIGDLFQVLPEIEKRLEQRRKA
ncbi:electron transfer flavoprotein subunit alpha/FixB family protein [Sphaerochaeta sp. S2]|uniref:electron transfer flavoprotein subunit alpha/FixB family protein n=1 Tax=Sphaerochaeta sp. S2 TaxID=2798868 RepID=UPI0018E9AFC6|nr:electron transfer flavoprotein subunit alpha/FixB family protein [Sphaerochaeta sp. S2]MBJ2357407.1 electron transfer flavoprotein subunit alpha/FixB family protein [Sphaerochaeta sp. S2]